MSDRPRNRAIVGSHERRRGVRDVSDPTPHARAPRRRALHPPLPTMSAWGASGAWASQVRSRDGSRPPLSPTAAGRDEARRAPSSRLRRRRQGARGRARDPTRPRSLRRTRGRPRLGTRLTAHREASALPHCARSSATARGERVASRRVAATVCLSCGRGTARGRVFATAAMVFFERREDLRRPLTVALLFRVPRRESPHRPTTIRTRIPTRCRGRSPRSARSPG